MREIQLALPELALIAATRGMLGVGIGLLLSGKLSRDHRVAAGCTLATIGLVSTIPLAIRAFRRHRVAAPNGHSRAATREPVYPS